MSYFLLPTLTQPKPSITQRYTLTPSVKKKMKTKFQNFNLGEVEVLTQVEQSRVKGGYIPKPGCKKWCDVAGSSGIDHGRFCCEY